MSIQRTISAFLVLVSVSVPTNTLATTTYSEAAKTKMCAVVRNLVSRFGIDGAIQYARRRGYSEAQINAARGCL